MTTELPSSRSPLSTRRELLDRVRIVLVICAVVASVFATRELIGDWHELGVRFTIRIIGIGSALIGLVTLNRPWAVRWAWPLAIGIIIVAYLLTALAGMLSPTHEYQTAVVLFVGAALTTATVVPWGAGPQCATVVVAAAALGSAVWWKDGSLHDVATDPGAAVLMAFGLSIVTAYEFHRYRNAHRRGLQERRRAEAAVRRLNARLEQRVAGRTAELQAANRRLASEIVERQRAAEALRASQAQLADTIDNSTALVALKDLAGRYLLVNREFERLVRRPRLEVVGHTDRDLFPSALAEPLAARDNEVLRSGAPVAFEQELMVDEARRTYVCVKFPLRGASATHYGVGSMATDITMLKRLQEELQRHQEELAHVLRLHTIGEMAAALAHEINQPLCAITNYAQGGAQRLRAGTLEPVALLRAFEQIALEGLRAGEILRGIRGLVRRQDELESAIDVNALAGEAVRVLEPQARQHGVTVRLESGAGLPPVQANPTQIEQVMVNLVLNGVQAIADGETPRREVVVATMRSGDTVEVAVSDTGGGIAPSIANKLFVPFFTTKTRGLGLGLAISRSIIENHGGRLWAIPNSGAGTTFRFSLPVAGV